MSGPSAPEAERIHPAERRWLLTLAACCLASIVVYALVFVRPANLLVLYLRPHVDLFGLWRADHWVNARFVAGFVLLGLMWTVMMRGAAFVSSRKAWVIVLTGAAVAWSVMLLEYPFGADDIFDNILRGRMVQVYGGNPYLEVGAGFPSDPFVRYAAWVKAPSVYGPAWELTAALATRFVGMGIVENVIAFKLLVGLFLGGAVALVAVILRRESPDRALAGTVAVAWNPIIVYETLGNGHNDMAMVFWIVAAVWAISRSRHTLAILSLLVGALFKFVPLMLLPVTVVLAFRQKPSWWDRLSFTMKTGAIAVVLVGLAYAPFWSGPATLGLWWRVDMFASSLPSVVRLLVEPVTGGWFASRLITAVALLATMAFAIWRALRAPTGPPWQSFAETATTTLLFFLLVTCPWLMQWYSLWPLTMAALLPPGPLWVLANLFGYSVLSNQFIVGPLVYWNRQAAGLLVRETIFGPLVLLASWVYALLAAGRSFGNRFARRAEAAPRREHMAPN